MKQKLIMENWRRYLTEEDPSPGPGQGPTVGEFLATWAKQDPNSASKIFGKAAKWMVGLAVGIGTGAAASLATGGVGAAAAVGGGAALGAAAGKASEAAVGKLFDYIAGKGGDQMAKFLSTMADQQVPDDQRTGLSAYYDIDDNFEKLLQGMDSDLANLYQKHLFGYFKQAFDEMGDASPTEPLSDYLKMTANDYLKRFLKKKGLSGVGVRVVSSASDAGR